MIFALPKTKPHLFYVFCSGAEKRALANINTSREWSLDKMLTDFFKLPKSPFNEVCLVSPKTTHVPGSTIPEVSMRLQLQRFVPIAPILNNTNLAKFGRVVASPSSSILVYESDLIHEIKESLQGWPYIITPALSITSPARAFIDAYRYVDNRYSFNEKAVKILIANAKILARMPKPNPAVPAVEFGDTGGVACYTSFNYKLATLDNVIAYLNCLHHDLGKAFEAAQIEIPPSVKACVSMLRKAKVVKTRKALA